ncbi:MAG: hypothetical protein B7Y90_13460 [Alphaproteobacteria bacterium 32-64-14]|nr:MAG: hypothetical protein B7Y90_13460 [Alphaproteobacteria bacterium 32-64-14]
MTPHDRVEIPRRKAVTICIAAGCRDHGKPKIVLCADTKGSSALGTTNVMQKVLPLTTRWMLGVAGDDDEINAFFRVARLGFLEALDQEPPIEIDDYNAEILFRRALATRSKDKKDSLVQMQVAMSYDELLNGGGAKLPPGHFDDLIKKTRAIRFRGSFLVAGVSYGAPFIVVSDENGDTSVHADFVAMGSGTYLAQSMMLLREHSHIHDLGRTLYTVYEAKRHAERESGVGTETRMYVLDEAGLWPVSEEGYIWLEGAYEERRVKELALIDTDPPEGVLEDFIINSGLGPSSSPSGE